MTASSPSVTWHQVPTPSTVRSVVSVRVAHAPDAPPVGTILFCHGLGMGAATYAPLQDHWVAAGFVVVAPELADSLAHLAQHLPDAGIDLDDPTGWMTDEVVVGHALELLFDPQHWTGRAEDVRAVGAHLGPVLTAAGVDPGPGRTIDELSARYVLVGHSFGAHTAQIVGGARADLGAGLVSMRDERAIAAAVLSPQGSGERGLTEESWASIDIPWLVVSGENDIAARGQGVEWRRQAYDLTPPGGRHLAVLRGIDHGLGGIAGSAPVYADDDLAVALVADLTTAFARAALTGAPIELPDPHPLLTLESK